MLPIKSGDIVTRGDTKYYVKSVSVSGVPLLTLLPIINEEYIAHPQDVELANSSEAVYRAKAVGLTSNDVVEIPRGMTRDEAQRLLNRYANRR